MMNSMNISDPHADDLTLGQVAERARCTVKTVRRALQSGQLTRRYTMSARGPQLMFDPVEVERWLRSRPGRQRTQRHAVQVKHVAVLPEWSHVLNQLEHVRSMLASDQARIADLGERLREEERALCEAQIAVALLTERLSSLERRVATGSAARPAAGEACAQPDVRAEAPAR